MAGFLVHIKLHEGEDVLVSQDIWQDCPPRQDSDTRYLALNSGLLWNLYNIRCLQVSSQISDVHLPSRLYASYCDRDVYAQPSSPITLASMVLGFPQATYDLVKANQLTLQDLRNAGQVMRTGEQIDLDGYRGTIKLCEPVRQGVLDRDTEITIVKVDAPPLYPHHTDSDLDLPSKLTMSHIALDPPDHLSFSIDSLVNKHEQTVIVRPLSRHILTSDDYTLFGSLETLLDLGLFKGDLVQLTARDSRLVSVVPIPAPDHFLFLHPILFFNMAGNCDELAMTFQTAHSKALPIAKSVTLGRVPSPASTDRVLQNSFLNALKLYFESKCRKVRAGDLLLLGVDETLARLTLDDQDDAFEEFIQSAPGHCDTFAWFKVIDIQTDDTDNYPGDASVDSSITRMVQAGVQRSKIPALSTWASYYGLPSPSELRDGNSQKLRELVSSTFSRSARRNHTCSTILMHGARGAGKRTMVGSVAASLGMHFLEVNCFDLVGETEVKTEAYVRLRFEKAGQCSPCVLLLRNIDALARKKDDMESGQESKMRFVLADCIRLLALETDEYPVAVIATTSEYDKIPDGILGCFRQTIEISAPQESERLTILQNIMRGLPLAPDVNISSLALRTAALVAADLTNILKKAQNYAQDRLDALSDDQHTRMDIQVAGGWITASDFDKAINDARRNYSDSIGAPKIPTVSWEDVGGLASVKDDIMDTIQLPLERPELFSSGMKKRSGILFYGPPGTGKTLLAKAVATSFSLNFFSVKGPELLNMYIGESEANVRRVFQRARDASPCVVFFDELDSVAPKRGNQGDSGGVMDRIVSQLLSELDGMSEGKDGSSGVFVIGATNRPDLLDPALLRPGRFDKMLYLGISDTDAAQLNILQALTRKFKLSADLDLSQIAHACPFTYTGADFYALCSDAMLNAMTRLAGEVDKKVKALDPPRSTQYFFDHLAAPADTDVIVTEADFRRALSNLIPSVSQSELDHYKKVQAQFSPIVTNGVKANGTNGHIFHEDEDDEEMYS